MRPWVTFKQMTFHAPPILRWALDGPYELLPTQVYANWARETEIARLPELFSLKTFAWIMKIPARTMYPAHVDGKRSCALNFPLQSHPACRVWMAEPSANGYVEIPYESEHPLLINTSVAHRIDNPTPMARLVLTISFYVSFDEVKEAYFSNQLLRQPSAPISILSVSPASDERTSGDCRRREP